PRIAGKPVTPGIDSRTTCKLVFQHPESGLFGGNQMVRKAAILLAIVLLAFTAACSSSSSSSAPPEGSGGTAAGVASSIGCPTQNTKSFAKTRFVADAALAAGAFKRYIFTTAREGNF